MTRAPRLSNATTSTAPRPSIAAREIASGRLAADDSVDGRSPRALTGARRTAAQQRLDERARSRMEATALHRGELVAHELLHARQRAAELLELALDERRQQRREHELRDGRRSLGRRHEPLERLRLGGSGQPRLRVRHDDDDPPLVRHRVTHEQRRRALASHAALDHEAAEGERPHPHRGSRRAPGGLGQGRRIERALVDRGERLRHREGQLRARPEPDVRRDRLEHAQMRAARKPQRIAAALARRPARAPRRRPRPTDRPPAPPRAPPPGARPPRRARRSGACRRRRPRACPRCRRAGASTRITKPWRARTPSPHARAGRPSCPRAPAAAPARPGSPPGRACAHGRRGSTPRAPRGTRG